MLCSALAGCDTSVALNQPEQAEAAAETSEETAEEASETAEASIESGDSDEENLEITISDDSEEYVAEEENVSDGEQNQQENEGEDSTEGSEQEEAGDAATEESVNVSTHDPNEVDLIFFMGQSNMSGVGGNPSLAPKVDEAAGHEYRAVSGIWSLFPIEEPFGVNENVPGAIYDFPGAKNGSLVSSFVNTYYKETSVPVIAVSASAGATTTDMWMTKPFADDLSGRVKRAQDYLKNNGYKVRNQYVIWLQGESDAHEGTTAAEYSEHMDNIIRPMFIAGFQKIFIITPGRTLSKKDHFKDIINAQIEMCRDSGYYALATTVLTAVSTEYMTDEWHYNQYVLNLVGEEAAKSAAYYANNHKEKVIYDYKNDVTYIPSIFDYTGSETAEKLDVNAVLAEAKAAGK